MDLQELKRWHWMAIGLLIGGLWAATQLFYGITVDDGDPDTLEGPFEMAVMSTKEAPSFVDFFENGNVYVSDLCLHPAGPDISADADRAHPKQAQWVTGTVGRRRFSRSGPPAWETKRFKYKAALPFVPSKKFDYIAGDWVPYGRFKPVAGYVKSKPASYPSIKDYFDALNRKFGASSVKYRYIWWEERWAIMTMYPLAGLLLIGGVWPTVLGLMVGAGLGKKAKTDDYDLARYSGKTPSPVMKPVGMTEADRLQLAAVEAELEKNLEGFTHPSAGQPVGATAAPGVRKLEAETVDGSKGEPQKAVEEKSFGAGAGNFYPTEIHTEEEEH
jgi:hypothetical protein